MQRCSIIVVLAAVLAVAAHAQDVEPTQRVLERLLVRAGEEICSRAGDSNVRFTVSQHPDAPWIATMLRDPANSRGCLSQIVDSTASAQLVIVCRDVQTTYANAQHQDTVVRSVVVDVAAIQRENGSQFHAVRLVDTTHVARTEVPMLDSQQHMATHGVVPARPTTLWEDIAQPVVFIAAAVVTVVLLFTVRSQ
jgi:hypothetical protein